MSSEATNIVDASERHRASSSSKVGGGFDFESWGTRRCIAAWSSGVASVAMVISTMGPRYGVVGLGGADQGAWFRWSSAGTGDSLR